VRNRPPKTCRSCGRSLQPDERLVCPACWDLGRQRAVDLTVTAGKAAVAVVPVVFAAVTGWRTRK
jgi:predicted nucleic acid-binding Zn ribbon protein